MHAVTEQPIVSPGTHPLTKKPEDSGYEIGADHEQHKKIFFFWCVCVCVCVGRGGDQRIVEHLRRDCSLASKQGPSIDPWSTPQRRPQDSDY